MRAGQEREHIGANGIERDVPQVEQASVADHDVQTEREEHVEQSGVDDAHPRIAELLRHQGQQDETDRRNDVQADGAGRR